MRFLLTNDDGFFAPGLLAVKAFLEKYGEVYIVAPHVAQSGKSVSITYFNNLKVHRFDEHTYSVEGTPADCILMASMILEDKFDVVVSGCNNGYNLSYDAMYSGTCGACYQALMFKKKAIAFSVDKFYGEDTPINEEMEMVFKYVIDNDMLSENYFLNVNMQTFEFERAKGIKFTRLYPRLSKFVMKPHHIPKKEYKVTHDYNTPGDDINYDITAVHNGYISITPLCLPTGDLDVLKELQKKDLDLCH